MEDDLGTIAENALNELEQADAAGDTPPTPPEGDAPNGDDAGDQPNEDDKNDDTPAGGEDDDVEKGKASEDNDGEEDDPNKESEDEDDPTKGAAPQGKQAQELTDEELLAELEKRGKKPEPKKEDEQPKETPRPREVPEDVWGDMNEFQRTVYNRLPFIEIRDEAGKSYRVKHNSQIPADFPWASDEAKNQFYAVDLPAQSVLAERIGMQLQGVSQQQQEQAKFQQEANEVVRGVDKLQEQGIVPKITAKPNTPEFNNDPGVQRANDILNLWNEYRGRGETISIETAGQIFKANHPELYQTKPTKSPADAERKQKSRNIAGTAGRGTAGDAKGKEKSRAWPVGTSAADIADAYADQLD